MPAYTAIVSVQRLGGPNRVAHLPAGETVRFGVHGAVAEYYGVEPGSQPVTSTTIDYVVAAAVG